VLPSLLLSGHGTGFLRLCPRLACGCGCDELGRIHLRPHRVSEVMTMRIDMRATGTPVPGSHPLFGGLAATPVQEVAVVTAEAEGQKERIVPCFTPGTAIATPRGERLVDELRVGDRIITRDNGIREIRWIGAQFLDASDLARNPHLRPILIKRGSLGENLPERDMMVSPNHRILVSNEKTSLYFEEREVLAAAKHMTGTAGINEVEVERATYIHFMFDQHEVVLSNGCWTESFQPMDHTLNGIGTAQRNEILELFPELATPKGLDDYHPARRSLAHDEAMLLHR